MGSGVGVEVGDARHQERRGKVIEWKDVKWPNDIEDRPEIVCVCVCRRDVARKGLALRKKGSRLLVNIVAME